jgi:flagellar M-ring protein FliF
MVLRLTTLSSAGALAGGGGTALAALTGPASSALAPSALAGVSVAAASQRLLEDESMVNIAQIEGQMRASSLRRISEIVEKHPDETLSIVRGWMVQESN